MTRPVRLLIVEDSSDDAKLAIRALRGGGFDPTYRLVQQSAELQAAFTSERWDAVISDFMMPAFTGIDALRMFRSLGLDIPFILVSGTIGEQTAVDAMKEGATDYVMKNNLARLAPALERGLREAALRAAKGRSEGDLTRSEERYRQLFHGNPLPLWVFDLETLRFLDVNHVACHTYGYSHEEFLDMTLRDVRSPEDVPAMEASVRATDRRPLSPEIWRHLRKDGTRFSVQIVSHDVTYQGRAARCVCVIDVTQRLEAEARLRESESRFRQLAETLERRVAERTAELEAVNTELGAFNYSVSHDLRSPLNRIQGFSAMLLEDNAAKLDAHGLDLLSRIGSAGRDMDGLIGDLLELSTVATGELRRGDTDISALARDVFGGLCRSQPDRKVEFVVEPGLSARADPGLLRIVLENLIGNAWKFTGKCDGARIELGCGKGEDGTVAFFVRDNGAGFDPAGASKLFAPFKRLHAKDEFEGTGIGLATVQRIVHRHGGRAWGEGAVGEGATFHFTLAP